MSLDFTGLDTRPSQTWGVIRLVPLVRAEPIVDLRLNPRLYGDLAVVQVTPRTAYVAYTPHAFVATWTTDGGPAAAYGTQLSEGEGEGEGENENTPSAMPLRFHHRMARRVDKDRLRFLPLHLALEGYLSLHFGGPNLAWSEWSQQAVRHGLSPRVEEAYTGAAIRDLDDALRIFEIHHGQCGVLLYVSDALAAAFVVPHPDDYRALHATLLQDLYGELLYIYGLYSMPVQAFAARITDTEVADLADLRRAAARQSAEWARFHDTVMAGTLLGGDTYTFNRVYTLGRFTLTRFLPSFRRHDDSHLGEAIMDEHGRLAYLKTYRLSQAQTKRGHLLSRLAANDWNMEGTAAELRVTPAVLASRIERAGFGYLLRQDVLDHYRAQLRRGT